LRKNAGSGLNQSGSTTLVIGTVKGTVNDGERKYARPYKLLMIQSVPYMFLYTVPFTLWIDKLLDKKFNATVCIQAR
jgi:hypothetical protein